MEKEFKGLYNIEAEQIVLGKIILNNEYMNKVADFLLPEFFYELAHQEVYKYISKTIHKSSIIADSITLKNFFDTNEILASIGGSNYLSVLINSSVGIVDIIDYARLIQDLAIKRKLIFVGEDIVTTINKNSDIINAQNYIEQTEEKLFELSNKVSSHKDVIDMGKSMSETLNIITTAKNRGGNISGVSVQLIDMDKLFGGFQNSDLIILAGRPSMGKSAVAINFAYNAAKFFQAETKQGKPQKSVAFFSLEMPANQITMRILSMETGIPSESFRLGNVDEGEMNKIVEKSSLISTVPLFIDDTAGLTIPAVKTKIRRLVRQENLGFVVIDYLQLMHGVTEVARSNRVQEISEITQGLKEIAKEFNIPVVALSQLSRTVEQREDKRPQLSDLRESGSIEQDADIVMFIYRESYYEERKKPSSNDTEKLAKWAARMEAVRNKAEIIVAKHRNGPIGNLEFYYNSVTTKLTDYLNRNVQN